MTFVFQHPGTEKLLEAIDTAAKSANIDALSAHSKSPAARPLSLKLMAPRDSGEKSLDLFPVISVLLVIWIIGDRYRMR